MQLYMLTFCERTGKKIVKFVFYLDKLCKRIYNLRKKYKKVEQECIQLE